MFSDNLETPTVDNSTIEQAKRKESRGAILDGVKAIASTMAAEYPQVTNGKLDYYFTGSVAAMLLTQTDRLITLDPHSLPEITPVEEMTIPAQARTVLADITRRIGDLDVAVLPDYREKTIAAMQEHNPADEADYEGARRKWVQKGIRINLPETAHGAAPGDSIKVDVETGEEPALVTIGGKDFYITNPKAMLEYKALHLIREFSNHSNKDKLINDLSVLVKGLSMIYPREELVSRIHNLFINQPNVVIPTYHPQFDPTSRAFFEEVVASDDNAEYLESLAMGSERSLGILNILRNYQDASTKQALIAFINDHREELDQWEVSTNDQGTQRLVADYISQHSDQYESLLSDNGITAQTVHELIKGRAEVVANVGKDIPREVGIVWEPKKNYYLDVLAQLDEKNIAQELSVVGAVMDVPPRFPNVSPGTEVKAIFQSAVSKRPDIRRALFNGIGTALGELSQDRKKEFLTELDKASRKDDQREELIDEGMQLRGIKECFSNFNIPFQVAQ